MSLNRVLRKVKRAFRGRPSPAADVAWYLAHGRRPWSRGYLPYRDDFVARAIGDPRMLEGFRGKSPLPAGYGTYLDERTVEFPWLFAHLRPGPTLLLDAGSILNAVHLVDHPLIREKKLHIVTLGPEASCFWDRGVSYLFADLRALPYADGTFDEIACISTLEHVGKDNAIYTRDASFRENRSTDFEMAIRELRRVCRTGGQLLLSVPYGRFIDFGWYQQFDAPMLDRAIAAFGPAEADETIFQYADGGWRRSDRDACAACEGFNIHDTKYFNPSSSLDYDPDFAAASRAVAAVRLTKGG